MQSPRFAAHQALSGMTKAYSIGSYGDLASLLQIRLPIFSKASSDFEFWDYVLTLASYFSYYLSPQLEDSVLLPWQISEDND